MPAATRLTSLLPSKGSDVTVEFGTIAWDYRDIEAVGGDVRYIRIVPSANVIVSPEGDEIWSGSKVVSVNHGGDEPGRGQIDLPPSTGVNPVGVTYTVTPLLTSGHLPKVSGIVVVAGETTNVGEWTSVLPAELTSNAAHEAQVSATLAAESEANAAASATAAASIVAVGATPFGVARATSTSDGFQRSPRPGFLPAFPRTANPGGVSNGTDTKAYSITAYPALYGGVGFYLEFRNSVGNVFTVKGSVVTPDTLIHPLMTSDGKTSLVVENNTVGWMRAGGTVAAGDVITVRLFVEPRDAAGNLVASGKWPLTYSTVLTSAGETVVSGSGASDLSLSTAASQPSPVVGSSFRPAAIYTQPLDTSRQRILGGVGDSITFGVGDVDTSPYGPGFLARACGGQIAFVNTGASGSLTGYIFTGTAFGALPLEVATTLYEAGGANDLDAGATLASLQVSKILAWRRCAAYGVRVRTCTLFPWDGLTSPKKAVRVAFNAWIRDGAPLDTSTYVAAAVGASGGTIVRFGETGHPVHGYDEIADAVESARDSGVYAVGYSGDGVHPNATGAAAAAAAVNLAAIV